MGTPGFGERALHTHADVTRAGTVRYTHAVPTQATRRESLEEGGALARRPRPPAHLVGIALGILTQARLIGQILRPTNIGWIDIVEDALPLVHLAVHHGGCPLPRCLTPWLTRTPTIDEGAGIGGVRQDSANRRFGGLTPSDVTGAEVSPMASGE